MIVGVLSVGAEMCDKHIGFSAAVNWPAALLRCDGGGEHFRKNVDGQEQVSPGLVGAASPSRPCPSSSQAVHKAVIA
jgi:hypothetical protein